MKILLAIPEDMTALGIIGGYCKEALRELGHEVMTFDFRQHPYSKNKIISILKIVIRMFFASLPSPYDISTIKELTDKKINRLLLDQSYRFRPDLVLVLLGDTISPESINDIKRKIGAVTASWLPD